MKKKKYSAPTIIEIVVKSRLMQSVSVEGLRNNERSTQDWGGDE